jgi:hypothetical protein
MAGKRLPGLQAPPECSEAIVVVCCVDPFTSGKFATCPVDSL